MNPATHWLAEIRANPRLRWGLWLIAGILWLYAILVLRDVYREQSGRYASLLKKVATVQVQAGQKEWLDRVDPATLMKVQLESRLWQSGTVGLAQAAFQDWLNQALAQTAVSRPAVTLAADDYKPPARKADGATNDSAREAAPEGLWKVKAKVEFDFNPQSFTAFMARVGSHDRQIAVESLTIRKEPIPRVEAVLTAYFQTPKEGG